MNKNWTEVKPPWRYDEKSYVSKVYPNHEKDNAFLFGLIKDNAKKNLVSQAMQTKYQSRLDNKNIKEVSNLLSWIESVLPDAVDEFNRSSGSITDRRDYEVSQYWGMYYLKGGGVVQHNHFPFPLACSYYINAPEGSSFNLEDQEIPVESGDLIIFRGNSYHAVKPSVEGRCMIACNIIYNPRIPRSGFKKINKGF